MKNNKKKQLKRTIISVTETVLTAVYEYLADIGKQSTNRFNIYSSLRTGVFNEWEPKRFSDTMHNLERLEYIKIDQDSDSVEFTNKAKLRITDYILNKKTNSEKYIFLSFDIPEEMRKQRNGFRSAIRRMGFRQIQKSLWVNNRNAIEMVDIAKEEYGVENYVIFIISEKTDIDQYIKNIFKKRSVK